MFKVLEVITYMDGIPIILIGSYNLKINIQFFHLCQNKKTKKIQQLINMLSDNQVDNHAFSQLPANIN
jgi:hypothetical protein